MEIKLEKLIEIIVREVVKELLRRGESIDFSNKVLDPVYSRRVIDKNRKCVVVDMSKYKTPLLTENELKNIDPATEEITIPNGTIITPGAKEIIKKQNLKLKYI